MSEETKSLNCNALSIVAKRSTVPGAALGRQAGRGTLKLEWLKRLFRVCLLCAATAMVSPAQSFRTLVDFDQTNGYGPALENLVQGTDGNFYGTTYYGGANYAGEVFKVTPGGELTILHSFCAQTNCTDGAYPFAGPIQGTNGNFYGTTYIGGTNACSGLPNNCGTVFEITPSGILTTLYSFCAETNCTDGENPYGALVQAANGNLYGTTSVGGANGSGTVFKITGAGPLTTLYSFCAQTNCADGANPTAGLVQGTDGNFYGTTANGGGTGSGTVFKISPSGALTTLYTFGSQGGFDGEFPNGPLVQAINGNFYGTTMSGGESTGQYCAVSGCGTAFEITPGGTKRTLYSFCTQTGCPDGDEPFDALIQGTDGNFYGTARFGGDFSACAPSGCGTVFKITPNGKLTTLHTFGYLDDGYNPYGGLVQGTSGIFCGTTWLGGSGGTGTVFSLSIGLGPFVETRPTSGKVGATVKILGTNLTGATSVTFNGAAAVFKVVSPSLITTTVPAGATSGTVQVVTPSGTLSSNVPFRVL
jgi:uncharacterized repeat protein (TIGR03803 family)